MKCFLNVCERSCVSLNLYLFLVKCKMLFAINLVNEYTCAINKFYSILYLVSGVTSVSVYHDPTTTSHVVKKLIGARCY